MTKQQELGKRLYAHFSPMIEEGVLGDDMAGPLKRACMAAAGDLLGKEGKRDLIFEALCEAMGADWRTMPKSAAARYNVAAKELREIHAEPAEVLVRAQRYRVQHPDWELTPTALVTHWPTLSRGTTVKVPGQHISAETQPTEPEEEIPFTPEMVEELQQRLRGVTPEMPRMYDD